MSNCNYIRASHNKSKAVWTLVNRTLGKNNRSKVSVLDNTGAYNAKSTLNNINEFFINQGSCVNRLLTSKATANITIRDESMYMFPTDVRQVFSTILNMKNTSSVGDDQIPVKLIKYTADIIAEPITYIINLALTTGVFPHKLKIANVIVIYKKGDKTAFENYRPISLLSNLSKIFEKIISERLLNYFEGKISFQIDKMVLGKIGQLLGPYIRP